MVWSPSATNNLFVMFHGERDFYLEQGPNVLLGQQIICGTGLLLDVWETASDTWSNTPFGPLQGGAGRTGDATYNGLTVGTKILSLASRNSFLNAAGQYGGLATEFQTNFNNNGTTGAGTSYLDVTGGTQAGYFDSNTFFTPTSLTAGVSNADVYLNWDIRPNDLAGTDWLAKSHDPAQADFLPEPATIVIWSLLGVLGLAVSWRRRRA